MGVRVRLSHTKYVAQQRDKRGTARRTRVVQDVGRGGMTGMFEVGQQANARAADTVHRSVDHLLCC
jgi:hypothetical protein